MASLFKARQDDPRTRLINGDSRLAFWEVSMPDHPDEKSYLITLKDQEKYRPNRQAAWNEYLQLKDQLT